MDQNRVHKENSCQNWDWALKKLVPSNFTPCSTLHCVITERLSSLLVLSKFKREIFLNIYDEII
jgi:hypothetical protein